MPPLVHVQSGFASFPTATDASLGSRAGRNDTFKQHLGLFHLPSLIFFPTEWFRLERLRLTVHRPSIKQQLEIL